MKCMEYMELVKESIVCGDTNADTVNNYWSPPGSVKYSGIRSRHPSSQNHPVLCLEVHANLVIVQTSQLDRERGIMFLES